MSNQSLFDKIDIVRSYCPDIADNLDRLYNGLLNEINQQCISYNQETIEYYDSYYEGYVDSFINYINRVKGNTTITSLIEDGVQANYSLATVTGTIVSIDFSTLPSFNGLRDELSQRNANYFFTGCIDYSTTTDPTTGLSSTTRNEPDISKFTTDEDRISTIDDLVSMLNWWKEEAKNRTHGIIYRALFESIDPPGLTKPEIAELIFCNTHMIDFIRKFELNTYFPDYLSCL